MRKYVFLLTCIVLCTGSFFGGYAWYSSRQPKALTQQDYTLLSKRLFVENPNDTIINFAPLREQINSYIQANNLTGSIYFEYLPTGSSIRVSGDDEYVAASLMKIPIVMELYKEAEMGKVKIDEKISLKKEWLDSDYGDLYKKGEGYELSLREAAVLALTKSDNTAINVILNNTRDYLSSDQNVISALDVSFNRDDSSQIEISARSYSSFLKCLYFSCYVSKADSQEILTYLTQSDFDSELRAGVPKEVQVAHKIGTYNHSLQSDCGIVYLDNRNYVLCVMLNVPDTHTGEARIADISKLTFEYVKDAK